MVKRLFDIALSLALLILLLPVMAIVAMAVLVVLGNPVLFVQQRPGLNARPFRLMKFRTMCDATNASGEPLSDAKRLGAFGRMLRATSLDELPQLVNILKGNMSFVGPRPLLMEYVPLYTRKQAKRMDVRPGLTGWAQVHGRNALDWPSRLAHDAWYAQNAGFLLDLKILAMTALIVIRREGISQDGAATMEPFRGENGDG